MRMKSKRGKIAVVALAGAITGILVWTSNAFGGVVVPSEVASMFQVVTVAVVQFLLPDDMEG